MRFPLLGLTLFTSLFGQSQVEEFRVYTEHPRLFLRPQRLRLLQREHQRKSMRFVQFETLLRSGAPFPEPAFSNALYYAATGDTAFAKRAVEAALRPDADLRQTALVLDWCQETLTPAQSTQLSARLIAGAQTPYRNALSIPDVRDRVLAAIAAAEINQAAASAVLRQIAEKWWPEKMLPALESGAVLPEGEDLYALLELLHALRDNLNLDLRTGAAKYFSDLAEYEVAITYPAPLQSEGNEYRIPIARGQATANVKTASFLRAAGLSTVALDTNALGSQFLQGWLVQDRFLLRTPLGSPYEFLWANPYLPGLSYDHLPLVFYSRAAGTLTARSSWDEDARWFGLFGGEMQLFDNGNITVLRQSAQAQPVRIGNVSVIPAPHNRRFTSDGNPAFLVGLKPLTRLDVEIDGEEMQEVDSGPAGVLPLPEAKGQQVGVRWKETSYGKK